MPVDSMLVSAAVVIMFVVFAGVMVWGERQTRRLQDEPSTSHRKHRSF
jgi:hypothetical protein